MSTTTPSRIAAFREFNRFYTRKLGMLNHGLLGTEHPLPEARILYELGQRAQTGVQDLKAELDVDAGYLSRLLTSLETQGLVRRQRSKEDGRRQDVALTSAGRRAYEELDTRSRAEIEELLERLDDGEQRRVLGAMRTLEDVWDGAQRARRFELREPRAGELGWVIQRHGALYHAEYAFNEQFEALVAQIVAGFAERADASERAWIADVQGEPAGCVFCMRKTDATAQLRLLLVEPDARGMGIGARLVEQCVQFAEQAGYTSMTLWTQSILADAHRLYERAGFTLQAEEPHTSFGRDLVGQTWARPLSLPTRT